MTRFATRILKSGALATAMITSLSASFSAYAEESLLWKSINTAPAVVVPAYGGAPSPFPMVNVPVVVVSSTSEDDEKRRMRDQAFQSALQVVQSSNALVPDLRSLVVGGMVRGTLGARVLIGNQWVAVGTQVLVRQYRSPQALDAIKSLSEYDVAAATNLTERLDSDLSTHPSLALTLQDITSDTLVFKSSRGRHDIKFTGNYN